MKGLPRWSPEGLVEAHTIALLVDFLHRTAILTQLVAGKSITEIARNNNLSAARLRLILEAVAARTDILRRRQDTFQVAKQYREYELLGHLLDKYLGAFGPCFRDPSIALSHRPAHAAEQLVDRARHATAFSRIRPASSRTIRELVHDLALSPLLEIGCGPASELIGAADDDPSFEGIGIDSNSRLISIAKQRIAANSLNGRVRVYLGDCRRIDKIFKKSDRSIVRGILASSLLNEMFDSESVATEFLRTLKALFPGVRMIVRDYYGSLGSHPQKNASALIHDLAQLLSRQGVPPPDHAGWARIYRSADCQVISHSEGYGPIRWFVDVVAL